MYVLSSAAQEVVVKVAPKFESPFHVIEVTGLTLVLQKEGWKITVSGAQIAPYDYPKHYPKLDPTPVALPGSQSTPPIFQGHFFLTLSSLDTQRQNVTTVIRPFYRR